MEVKLPIQIFVISLERSIDRRLKVEEQLKKTSLVWNFLNAVDGYAISKMPSSYNRSKVKRLQGYELSPGEIGCYLSHTKAWEACLENKMITLIFEDDFVLKPNFEFILQDLISISNEWDLVRFSGIYDTNHTELKIRDKYDLVQNLGDPCGTACYIITPCAAEILLKNSTDIYEPVDHYLEHFKKHGLSCLAAKPYPVELAHTKSTITDRPGREAVVGLKKLLRSIHRSYDRKTSPTPWFPKS